MAGTGGLDWESAVHPLYGLAVYFYLFVFYILFNIFVIHNTISSLFVQNLIELNNDSESRIIEHRIREREKFLKKLLPIFKSFDSNEDCVVTYDEFCSRLEDPRMRKF